MTIVCAIIKVVMDRLGGCTNSTAKLRFLSSVTSSLRFEMELGGWGMYRALWHNRDDEHE